MSYRSQRGPTRFGAIVGGITGSIAGGIGGWVAVFWSGALYGAAMSNEGDLGPVIVVSLGGIIVGGIIGGLPGYIFGGTIRHGHS